MSLKLAPLKDDKPVRLTLTLPPDVASALDDYAAIYAREHGQLVKPETLAPHMLDAFIKSDSGFKKARRALHASKQET